MSHKISSHFRCFNGTNSTGRSWLYLALLLFFLTAHNAWWLHHDIIDPVHDEANYLLNSLAALEELHVKGITALKHLYFQSFEQRPTFFFSALSLPFLTMFGTTADVAILSTNIVLYAIIIIFTFLIGRYLFDDRTGLLASLVTALSPGVSVLSRIYWPHLSVVSVTTLGTYLLLKSKGFSRTLPSIVFGITLGIGLMMRPAYPGLFLLAPSLWVIFQALFCKIKSSSKKNNPNHSTLRQLANNTSTRLLGRALPALIVALLISGPYYLPKIISIIEFVSSVHSENVTFSTSNNLWYFKYLPEFITPLICINLVIGLIVGIKRLNSSTGFLVFSIVATFIIISIPSFKRSYYLPPIFPLLSITATYWIFHLRISWLRKTLVCLTILTSFGAFIITAWGFPNFARTFLQNAFTVHTQAPNHIDWPLSTIANLIQQNRDGTKPPEVGFIATNPIMLEPTFRYFAVSNDNIYVSPVENLKVLLTADFIVTSWYIREIKWLQTMKPPLSPYFQNGRLEALQIVQNPKSTFHSYHQVIGKIELANDLKIAVFKRSQAVSPREILDISSEMISLSPKTAKRQLKILLGHKKEMPPEIIAAYKKSMIKAKVISKKL